MVNFNAVIDNLISIGVYQVVLPFLLVYAIIFAILQKSKIFEGGSSTAENAKSVNAVVAFVFGLFVVASIQVVQLIQSLIINAVLILIFLLCVVILLGFLFGDGYKEIFENKIVKWTFFIGIFIVVLGIFLYLIGAWDWFFDLFDSFDSSGTFNTILVFALIGGVLYFITKGDSKSNTGKTDEK